MRTRDELCAEDEVGVAEGEASRFIEICAWARFAYMFVGLFFLSFEDIV
jgi:hypothetical protein